MGKPTIETVSAGKFPEVRAFAKQQRALAQVKEQNPEVFARLEAIAATYNATLLAADKVVRTAVVKCGPWDLYSFTERYSAKAFFEAVGRSEFTRFGGAIQTVETYDFDKDRFKALLEQERVTPEAAEQCLSYGANYHSPTLLLLP